MEETGCSSGSDDAGRVNATFTSLLASCPMVNVEPWSYLRDLFCLLPRWPKHRVLELAPGELGRDRPAGRGAADPELRSPPRHHARRRRRTLAAPSRFGAAQQGRIRRPDTVVFDLSVGGNERWARKLGRRWADEPMTSATTSTDFSAADAALGYLYQVRLALFWSLERLSEDQEFSAYLETLDDVVFEPDGAPLDLLQTKHHCERAANLTDASPDLWKTLRVWMEGRKAKDIPLDARLFLVTTAEVGVGAAATYLRSETRDEERAHQALLATARTSTNATNATAYELFRKLKKSERLDLLRSVVIKPVAPSITDLEAAIRKRVRFSTRPEHLTAFSDRLEAWWLRQSLRQLASDDRAPILSRELEAELAHLRDQFTLGALPVDDDILSVDVDDSAYGDRVFVHQAHLTGVGQERILAAIRDYYRAFTQRSKWAREDLLLVGELDRYEQRLREEWTIQFARVGDDMGELAEEEAKRRFARRVFAWMEDCRISIRARVTHESMVRGSLHMLADDLRVGWHPEFVARLSHLLERTKEAS